MPMTTHKKLLSIKDEVKEFHPLLQALLPKLPDVRNVEYTHGTREMGADFVISRDDKTFDDIEYIGIVAKVGQIGQNFSDVARQIEECKLERTFMGGKKKIQLTEIWVIATKNITPGAKDKILAKYAATKIKFVSGAQLSKLIDTHIPVFWSDVKVAIGDYLTNLNHENKEADNRYSLIQMDRENFFYIEQDIYEFPREHYRKNNLRKKKAPKRATFKELVNSSKLTLVEGGMGGGKSKLLRKIVDHYSNPDVYNDEKILPVLVSYNEFLKQFSGNIDKLLQEMIPPNTRSLEDEFKYLILIDGIDEKKAEGDEQISLLEELSSDIAKRENVHAIVTSRYLRTLDQSFELEKEIVRYHLPPLRLGKTIEFVKQLCTELNLSSRLLEDLKKSQLFHELPQSPIAAILLAKLINENPEELPSNITELYSQYTELTLGRWDTKKGLQLQTLKEYKAMEEILKGISKVIFDNGMPYAMLGDTKEYVETYLAERNFGLEADDLFEKLISRCELITVDREKNIFEFKHRTFGEFFYALGVDDSNELFSSERAFNLYWQNIVFFHLGLKRDAPILLEKLIEIEPASELERWLRLINLGNYFLAAHGTPYKVISKGVSQVAIDAAYLYRDIVEGQIESPFSNLPHMDVLHFLNLLIREGYSYEFFREAIENSALSISDSNHDEYIKAYAIFLLNIPYIEMGAEVGFDFLLKDYAKELPIELSLAISHEAKRLKEKTTLFKRHDAKIKKRIQKSPQLKAYVESLYTVPLKDTLAKDGEGELSNA
jgi:hypothetical protein